MTWKIKIQFQRNQSQMVKVGYIAPHTYPSPYEIWSYKLTKKKKKGISRQVMSSWKQDSLVISTEPKPKENRKTPVIQSTHLNLDLPNQGSHFPFQLTALLPATDMLNHPPVPQLMAHKALGSSNSL